MLLLAFAIFKSVKYGPPTMAAAVALLAVPFAFRTNQVAQSALLPLAVLVIYSFGPIRQVAMAHTAFVRRIQTLSE